MHRYVFLTALIAVLLAAILLNSPHSDAQQQDAELLLSNGSSKAGVTPELKLVDAENKALDKSAINMKQIEDGTQTIVLDGMSYLLSSYRNSASMTLHLKVRFSEDPRGMLFSRNRPEEGLRGFECGLVSEKFYEMNGPRPAAMISSGTRDSIKYSVFPADKALKKGIWYEFFFRFEAGKKLQLDVFDLGAKKHLGGELIPTPTITELSDGAGNLPLAIGGRRQNSKLGTELLPAGTELADISVWDYCITDKEIAGLNGMEVTTAVQILPREPMTLHVDAGSKADVMDGKSIESAFSTVQQAFDNVQPGDTILIHPGIYFEIPVLRTLGTKEKPITIRAASCAKDAVIITAANKEMRQGISKWTLEDEEKQIYSTPFNYLPARVLYSGVDLLPYIDLEGLKKFELKEEYPGARHGFCYDPQAKKLYVRLHADNLYGSQDPGKHIMCASLENAGGSNGQAVYRREHSNILIEPAGEGNINIEGITFESPAAAAVVSYAGKIKVSDCWFRGCRWGVFGVKLPSEVLVEHCDFHHFPAFDDVKEVIKLFAGTPTSEKHKFFWWHRKGVMHDRNVMKNYETGIIGGVGKGWTVANNNIHDAFEGMSCWSVSDAEDLTVRDNLFSRLVDNAVETENHAKNVRIFHNDIVDVFEPISWQPLAGLPWPGPVFVYDNRFYSTPDFRTLWSVWTPGCFKLGVSGKNWSEHEEMGKVPVSEPRARISKRFVFVPYPGFLVFNNTILFEHGDLLTTPQPTERELVNFRFFNNVIAVRFLSKNQETFKGSLIEFYNNAVVATNETPELAKVMAGLDGEIFPALADLKLEQAENGVINPAEDSPLKNKGTLLFEEAAASTDLGAVPAGKKWLSPKVGPRTAK